MKKIAFLMTSCKKSGPVQQMLNIIKNLDRTQFEPILVTMYDEDPELSQLDKYLPYVKHYHAPTSKLNVVTGRVGGLKKVLNEIQPDVIHSLGVFPDFAVSRMKKYPQIITLRNFVWEDYPAKFGKLKGSVLARLHLYAMKHTAKTVACSQSLSEMYRERLHLDYDYIRNGVDVEKFTRPEEEEKTAVREELSLPRNAFIYVYSGQIIERKNQRFLLDAFKKAFPDSSVYLLLLGDGADYETLKSEFGGLSNVDFRGSVSNVDHYLKACDAYVATSKSEGMPNGVLEAMATGLPVVLSDIEQHLEVLKAAEGTGFSYKQGDSADLINQMNALLNGDYKAMGAAAYDAAHSCFSAKGMSEKYQEQYAKIAR